MPSSVLSALLLEPCRHDFEELLVAGRRGALVRVRTFCTVQVPIDENLSQERELTPASRARANHSMSSARRSVSSSMPTRSKTSRRISDVWKT